MRLLALTLILSSLIIKSSQGQIGFSTKTYPIGNDLELRAADLNHDGKPDLVGSAGGIYLNDGNGGFTAGTKLNPQGFGEIIDFKIADMNEDGAPDVVVCIDQESQSSDFWYVLTYVNNGAGKFTSGKMYAVPNACTSLVVSDVNHDGRSDVVVSYVGSNKAGTRFTNNFATYFNDGAAKLSTPTLQTNVNLDIASSASPNPTSNCAVQNITSGDFFLNGQVSLIVNTTCSSPNSEASDRAGTAFLANGDGTGHFTFTPAKALPESVTDGQTVDLDGDGKPDVLFKSTMGTPDSNIYYAQNSGEGSLDFKVLTGAVNTGGAKARFNGISAGDLTGDGIKDIASIYSLVNENSSIPGPTFLSILAGSPNSTFVESQHWLVDANVTAFGNVVTADFNGDGKMDIATVLQRGADPNPSYSLYVYTNRASTSTGCKPPATGNTNTICSPAQSANIASPVTVTAASNISGFTLNRLYLDDHSVYQTASQLVNTPIATAAGKHTLVLVSYNQGGQAFTSSRTFTIGAAASGCLPTTPGAKICTPSAGSTSNSPVTFTAGAFAQSGNITALRGYIDNVAVFTVNNPATSKTQQVARSIVVGPGTHTLVVLGYQSTGGQVSTSQMFHVTATSCYPSTAGATICSPSPDTTINSPVTIVGGATAGSGSIASMRVYVDDVSQPLIDNPQRTKSFAINARVNMAPGKHTIVVVGYQTTGGSVSTRITINVH